MLPAYCNAVPASACPVAPTIGDTALTQHLAPAVHAVWPTRQPTLYTPCSTRDRIVTPSLQTRVLRNFSISPQGYSIFFSKAIPPFFRGTIVKPSETISKIKCHFCYCKFVQESLQLIFFFSIFLTLGRECSCSISFYRFFCGVSSVTRLGFVLFIFVCHVFCLDVCMLFRTQGANAEDRINQNP